MERSILTIGITAFNSGSYLQDAIDSVLEQNNAKWKGVLVLDGGADWKTKKIFNSFQHSKFEKFQFKSNQGPYGTRVKAIEMTKTEWYYQLDGDDLLPKNSVDDIISTIKNNPDAEYIFGDCEKFSKTNSFIRKPYIDEEMLCYSTLFNAQSPIKKDLYTKLGGYDRDLFINADWDFWLSVHENKIKGAYTGSLVYSQRKRKNNIGHTHIQLRPKNVSLIIKKHQKYFNNIVRKNKARFYVNEILARYYRSIGDRNKAAVYAEKAMEYGEINPVLSSIFEESEMNIFRYLIRRIVNKVL